MRRAGHERPLSLRVAAPPLAAPPTSAKLDGIAIVAAMADDEPGIDAGPLAAPPASETILRVVGRPDLEIAIRQRIESRLPGRIRNLSIRVIENVVILEGQCSTYYTKQLAQHAAMGVIDDEQLENAIIVGTPK